MLPKSNPGGLGPNPEESLANSEEGNDARGLWFDTHKGLVEANAASWFEELGPQKVTDLFRKQVLAQAEAHAHSAFFNGRLEATIIPGMETDLESLGEPQALDSTALGRAVMSELDSRGVSYRFLDSMPISHFQSIQLDLGNELVGQWGTELESPFLHHFQVFKDKSGEETGVWFVQLLASPLPLSTSNEYVAEIDGEIHTLSIPEEELSQGMLSFGEISSKVHLPILLKNLAFLAETPLPGTQLMSFSRNLAFGEVPEISRPTPMFSILKDSAFLSFAPDDLEARDSHSYKGQIVPELVIFGWRFGKESLDFISSFLPTIVDGCTRAVSTIEDGYRNYRNEESSIDYDSVLSNPCSYTPNYVRGESRLARPQWIPVTELGLLVTICDLTIRKAKELLDAGKMDQAKDEYQLIAYDGLGWYLVSAINTLEYQWYIPGLASDPSLLSSSEYYLKQAISLNVLHDSTNALTNLGLARMMAGEYSSAKEALEEAISREDNDGNAEAKHYLSLLYSKLGKPELEKQYAAEAKAAGGFVAPGHIEAALKLDQVAKKSSKKLRAQFCDSCGAKFEKDESNFCVSCGTPRLSLGNG